MYVLGVVLAGGRGERLYPLTQHRAKPAVPFGGRYRIIDFVLSNFVNSGILSIYVLTQFKAQSLLEHLDRGWRTTDFLGEHFVTPVPAQMRSGDGLVSGNRRLGLSESLSARAPQSQIGRGVWRRSHLSHERAPDDRRAPEKIGRRHGRRAAGQDRRSLAVRRDRGGRRLAHHRLSTKNPSSPNRFPASRTYALVSMGNYLFNNEVLIDALDRRCRQASEQRMISAGTFLPDLIKSKRVYAYDFRKNRVPSPSKGEEPSYWRDLGTIDAYYEANMDLCSIDPSFNLYNRSWPLRTVGYADPPAKFVFDWNDRQGMAVNSVVAEGTIISGSHVHNCVVGRNVSIHSFSQIENSVIMDWVEIGSNCRIRHAIIDKANVIPSGTEIGYDADKTANATSSRRNGLVVLGARPAQNYLDHGQAHSSAGIVAPDTRTSTSPNHRSFSWNATSAFTATSTNRRGKILGSKPSSCKIRRLSVSRLERAHHRANATRPMPSRASSTSEGRIVKLVNNYAKISFNFGPTLLSWLEAKAPEVYAGDSRGRPTRARKNFPATARRMAQVYNHVIMPLANQPRPGHADSSGALRDFEHRFKRAAGRHVAAGNRRGSGIARIAGAATASVSPSSRRIRPRACGAIGESDLARNRRRSHRSDAAPIANRCRRAEPSRYFFMTARSPAPSPSRACSPRRAASSSD